MRVRFVGLGIACYAPTKGVSAQKSRRKQSFLRTRNYKLSSERVIVEEEETALRRGYYVTALAGCVVITLLAGLAGRIQDHPLLQPPYWFNYGNLLFASGLCWGVALYVYGKTGPGTAEHKLLRSLVGGVAVFYGYKMFVPRVILKHAGYIPDTFESWLCAGMGAGVALVFVVLLWVATSIADRLLKART